MMTPADPSTAGKAWLQLIRVPNLLTVPGDPIAGALLTQLSGAGGTAAHAMLAIPAAVLLYMAGLISNDCADFNEDCRERPQRPLPSDAISVRAACGAWIASATLGIACAFAAGIATGIVGLALLGVVLAYNYRLKHTPYGPLAMGSCRGMSLLLGATAGGWRGAPDAVPVAALGLALYVAAVTAIAARETETIEVGFRRWLPAAAGLFCLTTPLPWAVDKTVIFIFITATAVLWPLTQARALVGTPPPSVVGRAVGGMLRGLLLIQAAYAALAAPDAPVMPLAILCLWPINAILTRHFYTT